MSKGRSGYEILRGFVTGQKIVPVEKQFFNPLDAKIGNHVRITNALAAFLNEKDVDLNDDLFKITEIWAWDRSRHGSSLPPMADYVLESGDKKVVLRVIQTINRGVLDDPKILLLTQHWPESDGPYPWGEDSPFVLDGCMDENGQLTRHLGTENEEVYFRDLSNVHCQVSLIKDENLDGHVDIEEVQKLDFSLWTFRRDTKDLEGLDYIQHLHVQLSGKYDEQTKRISGGDKTIVMHAGESIPSLSITMY